jgi:hypothetical protein
MKLKEIIITTIYEYLNEQYSKNIGFDNHKKKQLNIILNTNPMLDDYHTGIRELNDIKTLEEIVTSTDEEDLITTPDFNINDIKKAIKTNNILIYSSYPIQNGTFVTPSKMMAQSYSGDGRIYSKNTNIYDVAWIDAIEGQFAKI